MPSMENRRALLSPAKQALLDLRLRSSRADSDRGGVEQLPAIVARPEEWLDPFPLTEIQQAYWIGRRPEFELGNVAMHVYFELETELEIAELERAWNQLIRRHSMMRAVITEEGLIHTLPDPPQYQIAVEDLRGAGPEAAEEAIARMRAELSHQVLPSNRWPLFDIRAIRADERSTRLLLSIDGLIADAASLIVVLKEWRELYRNPAATLPPLDLAFRDCVLAEAALRGSDDFNKSLEFWKKRVEALPPGPDLPLAKAPAEIRQPRFTRHTGYLGQVEWERLKARAGQAGITPSATLLAAFGATLRQWCASPSFTLNVTVFNRLPLHPQIERIVGDFTSLIPVAIEHERPEAFLDEGRRAQAGLFEGLSHRAVSGVRVLREYANLHGGAAGGPMAVVFTSNLTHSGPGESTFPFHGIGKLVYAINQTPQVWLDQQVMEENGALVFHWDAVEELFPEGMIDDMFAAYCGLVRDLAAVDEIAWNRPVPALLPERQRSVRLRVNDTGQDFPEPTIWELFLQSAAKWGDRTAVIDADRELTYSQLARMAAVLGERLRALGTLSDAPVAILMEKGWEQVAAALGILASGGAYLPIDTDAPADRIRWLMDHGQVKSVLTQDRIDGRMEWPEGLIRIVVDREAWDVDKVIAAEVCPPASLPRNLAYVLYTSGSTGVPKGVMIEQRSVINRMADIHRRFDIRERDRVIALTALHHDLSVFDLFGTLMAGAALVIPQHDLSREPGHWVEIIKAHGVTIWNSVPAFLEMLVDYLEHRPDGSRELPFSLRHVLLAGDWIPVTLPGRLQALLPDVRVTSLGGPTETTVWDICFPFDRVDPAWKSIPYGKPLANASYHVLDEELQPRPEWVRGVLYIGGIGLARGYWRDERLTAERFVSHPTTGERLYRSGDVGRYLPSGDIEFVGRTDFQVKIQGHRVELGEIEAVLQQYPGVRACVVAAPGEGSHRRLVAYVVGPAAADLESEELLRYLAKRLPEHMLPKAIVPLDSLPLTRNGKLDRGALPAPQSSRSASPPAPLAGIDPLERRISAVAARVLNLHALDAHDDFFALGATSIEVVRIANLLEQEFGHRPAINQLVRLKNVAAIAAYYAEQQTGMPNPQGTKTEVLLDPAARDDFKHRQFGIRRFFTAQLALPLQGGELDPQTIRLFRDRRSTRKFDDRAVSAGEFGGLLACLRQISLGGEPKYRWASGGGLYPVQVYVHVKPERVESIAAGTYYYHPVHHQLFALEPGALMRRDVHFWNNQSTFDSAAFSIFLIADRRAIEPMYGEQTVQFCLIEAGGIAHLLESNAPFYRIGLCQAANVSFDAIRSLFHLDDAHFYLHALLGGPLPEPAAEEPAAAAANWEEGQL